MPWCSPLSKQADGDRGQRPRQRVGGEHREHDGKAERREQILRRPVQEQHRDEHAADRERRDQGRHRDLGRAVQRRIGQRLVLLGEQPVRVLDRHRGIVDQDADREREAAERHGVDGVAEEVEHHQRRQDRERDRDDDDEGRAPRAEEQDDHQRGQRRGDGAFAQHAVDRFAHEHRLVEQLGDLQARRRRGARDRRAPP